MFQHNPESESSMIEIFIPVYSESGIYIFWCFALFISPDQVVHIPEQQTILVNFD